MHEQYGLIQFLLRHSELTARLSFSPVCWVTAIISDMLGLLLHNAYEVRCPVVVVYNN